MFSSGIMKEKVTNAAEAEYLPGFERNLIYKALSEPNQRFIHKVSVELRLTHMDIVNLITAGRDIASRYLAKRSVIQSDGKTVKTDNFKNFLREV